MIIHVPHQSETRTEFEQEIEACFGTRIPNSFYFRLNFICGFELIEVGFICVLDLNDDIRLFSDRFFQSIVSRLILLNLRYIKLSPNLHSGFVFLKFPPLKLTYPFPKNTNLICFASLGKSD